MDEYDAFGPEKFHDIPIKELKETMKNHNMITTGTINDLRKRCKFATPPIPKKKKCEKLMKGHAGQPIGLMELLWRRGYADPELSAKELTNDKACRLIAKEIPQFKNELSEIEIAMKELDADAVFIPKGHCELAGRRIKCLWGCC